MNLSCVRQWLTGPADLSSDAQEHVAGPVAATATVTEAGEAGCVLVGSAPSTGAAAVATPVNVLPWTVGRTVAGGSTVASVAVRPPVPRGRRGGRGAALPEPAAPSKRQKRGSK